MLLKLDPIKKVFLGLSWYKIISVFIYLGIVASVVIDSTSTEVKQAMIANGIDPVTANILMGTLLVIAKQFLVSHKLPGVSDQVATPAVPHQDDTTHDAEYEA